MNSVALIKRLCDAFGPSGLESEVAEVVKSEMSTLDAKMITDRMGNVIAIKRYGDLSADNRIRIMISAHLDEVGFMITEIKKDGYLGIDTVGGISESVLAGRRVCILGKQGHINGVIASKAIHHKDKKDRDKTTPIEKLYIDIGAKDKEQAEEYVSIGDFATFDSPFYEFGEGMVKGKALDDRMGCAALIEVMRAFDADPPTCNADICFCFTVREEIGLSGAKTAAFSLRPDIAIVLETTAIADIADVEESAKVANVREGAVISVMDRSTIYCKQLVELAMSTAKKYNIKAQIKRYVSGGNDAGSIHKSVDGIKTLAISVPTRYLHSPACVASIEDYQSVRDLCEKVVRALCEKEQL